MLEMSKDWEIMKKHYLPSGPKIFTKAVHPGNKNNSIKHTKLHLSDYGCLHKLIQISEGFEVHLSWRKSQNIVDGEYIISCLKEGSAVRHQVLQALIVSVNVSNF